jgi:hypothetical protein
MQSYDGFQPIPTFFQDFARSCRDKQGRIVTTSRKFATVVASRVEKKKKPHVKHT